MENENKVQEETVTNKHQAKHEKSPQRDKHARKDEPEKRVKREKPKKKRSPLKTLFLIILLLAAGIAGTVAYFYKTAADSLSVEFTEEAPRVEFGGEYDSMDFVSNSEGEVTPSEKQLDAATTGKKQITYTVAKPVLGGLLTPSKEVTLDYTVTDSVDPLMIWSGNGTVLERGTSFDINNVIAYGDNADPEPSVTVDGEVDMDKNGSYPLHVTVTDASGNKIDWDLTVEVADSLPSYTDNSARTAFTDFRKTYKGDGRSFGIDVSAWQDEVDFKAAKAAGCEFVMIRIGYGAGSDVETDKQFQRNIEEAKKAGLKVGVYFYSYDALEESASMSADWIIEKLDGAELDLPVAFDWEDFTSFQTYKMSFTDLNKLYDAFADELASAGYNCMLYGSKVYLENVWEDTDTRPVWLAHYTQNTDYKGPYRIWQASCTGRIDGIDGDVDMDIMFEE